MIDYQAYFIIYDYLIQRPRRTIETKGRHRVLTQRMLRPKQAAHAASAAIRSGATLPHSEGGAFPAMRLAAGAWTHGRKDWRQMPV